MESGSGSEHIEGVSGNEQENEQQPKKKRYHRHTIRQIQEMESYVFILFSLFLLNLRINKKMMLHHLVLVFLHIYFKFCRLFKECPHPDDKQRMKLSQDLGLKPRQVKFWFQNRRTQMKVRTLESFNGTPTTLSSISFHFHGNPKISQLSSLHDSREKKKRRRNRRRFVY